MYTQERKVHKTSIAGEGRHERICMDLVYMRMCAWEHVFIISRYTYKREYIWVLSIL